MESKSKSCPLSRKRPVRVVRTPEEVKMDQALKKYYSKDLFSLPPEPFVPDNVFMLEGRKQMEERELDLMNQTTSDSDCLTDELEPGEIPRDNIPKDLRVKMEVDSKREKMATFNPYLEREKKLKRLQSFGYPPQNVGLKLYKCELISCERKFYNLYDFLDHRRLHEIGDLPPFVCPVCGNRYAKLKRCAIHMSIHRNNGEIRAPGTDYSTGHLIMSKASDRKRPMTQLDADYLLAKKLQDEEDEAARKNNKLPAEQQSQLSNLECLADAAVAAAACLKTEPMKVVDMVEDTEFQYGPDEPTEETDSGETSTTLESVELVDLISSQESRTSHSVNEVPMTPEEQLLADYLLAQSLQEEEDNKSRNNYVAHDTDVKQMLNTTMIIQHDVETECDSDSDIEMNDSEKLQMDLVAARYNAERRAAGAVVESSSQDSEIIID